MYIYEVFQNMLAIIGINLFSFSTKKGYAVIGIPPCFRMDNFYFFVSFFVFLRSKS